jgi:hypothetical protein
MRVRFLNRRRRFTAAAPEAGRRGPRSGCQGLIGRRLLVIAGRGDHALLLEYAAGQCALRRRVPHQVARVPVDVIARRLGHDPYTLLKSYAKEIATDKDRITKELAGMVSL